MKSDMTQNMSWRHNFDQQLYILGNYLHIVQCTPENETPVHLTSR